MQSLKIEVHSKEESIRMQEIWFSLGFRWSGSTLAIPEFTDEPYLFADYGDMSITYSNTLWTFSTKSEDLEIKLLHPKQEKFLRNYTIQFPFLEKIIENGFYRADQSEQLNLMLDRYN